MENDHERDCLHELGVLGWPVETARPSSFIKTILHYRPLRLTYKLLFLDILFLSRNLPQVMDHSLLDRLLNSENQLAQLERAS